MSKRIKPTTHQRFQFEPNCQAKRRFANKQQAEAAAELQMLTDQNLELHVYHCPRCGGWHLSSRHNKSQ